MGEGVEGVVGCDGVHGGAVSAVAEGFEDHLVAGLFKAVLLDAGEGKGELLLPAELGFLEEELFDFEFRFAEEGLYEVGIIAVLEVEEGIFQGVFFEALFEVGEENEGFGAESEGGEDWGVFWGGFKEGDVENDVGEIGVMMVGVGEPVVGVEVDFDVTGEFLAIYEDLGFFEVRAFELVPAAGVEDLDAFFGVREEVVGEEVLTEPDFLEGEFGDGYGAVESLEFFFSDGGGRASQGLCSFHDFCDNF